MKCGFKTNKMLTALKETGHTVTTSEGRIIHKILASKPLKFQTSRRTDEQQKSHQPVPQMRKIQQWRILRNSPAPQDRTPRLKQQHCRQRAKHQTHPADVADEKETKLQPRGCIRFVQP